MKLTNHIENIVQKSEESKLAPLILKNCDKDIEALSGFLRCSKMQALLFAVILHNTLESGSAELNELARHFGVSVMTILSYKLDLDELIKQKYIRQENNHNPFSNRRNMAYFVHHVLIDSILKSKLADGVGKANNNIDLLQWIAGIVESAQEQGGGGDLVEEDVFDFCRQNNNLGLAGRLLNSNLQKTDLIILTLLAYKLINGEDKVSISDACEFLDNNKHKQLLLRRKLMSGKNELIVRGLADLVPGMFRNDSELTITDKGLEYLLGREAEELSMQSSKAGRVIVPENILPVNLFMNKKEEEQLHTLQGVLSQERFSDICKRMYDKNMKAGFSILLYGGPGTGKTESVYQLARQTGRSILPVEISNAKSMWFGESEKLIKGIFELYDKLRKGTNIAPILLFNEADAIFGKRTTQMDSSVSQTLNAMQNIILQEMEDFEGIMIATTNLTENFDPAFDRRFLYKIRFENPGLQTRMQIMQNKIPFISPEAIGQLCEQYKLTGGQVANIAKKCSIYEMLEGKEADREKVDEFCKEELGLREKVKLGF
jgi:hypothetical protein